MSAPQHTTEKDVKAELEVAHVDHMAVDEKLHPHIQAIMDGQVASMSIEDRQAAYDLARAMDPGPKWYSRGGLMYLLAAFTCFVSSGDGGFDGTIFSSVNSMSQFLNYFDLETEANQKTGLIFGMGSIGTLLGFVPAYWLPDRFGRRLPMFIGNLTTVAGALLNGLAKNFGQLLGGRLIVGVGGMIGGIAVKPYLAEITTQAHRGKAIGLFNSMWYVGNILATGISIPFGYWTDNNWAWRIPVLIQGAPSVVNTLLIYFIPESPRWLIASGQRDKALQVLAKLHSRDGDINSPVVQLELQEMEMYIVAEGKQDVFDFKPVFATKGHRHRFYLGAMIAVWGQLSGNGMVSYFLPILLQQAGITDTNKQRVLNFASSVVSYGCATGGALVVDNLGRRPLLLFGESSATILLCIIAGLVRPGGQQSTVRSNAGITFIFLFSALYSFGWTPMQSLYPAEIFSYGNRTKALALQSIIMSVVSCINSFGIPPALISLSWGTYLLFAGWDLIGTIVIWIWAVETKGLTLEQLDEVFDARNPKKASVQIRRDAKIMARSALADEA